MHRLRNFLNRSSEFCSIVEGVGRGLKDQAIFGLSGSQKAFVLAALALKLNRPYVVVTYSEEHAQEWLANLSNLVPEQKIAYYPALEWMPFNLLGKSREIEGTRLKLLAEMDEKTCIVTTIQAIERLYPPREKWFGLSKHLEVAKLYSLDELYASLLDMGYERVAVLEGPGQFSVRGGILDIFSLAGEPVRLEFFDDELDSIRTIDPITQRSVERLEKVTIYPAREMAVSMAVREKAWPQIMANAAKIVNRLKKSLPQAGESLDQQLAVLAEKISEGVYDGNFEICLNYCYPRLDTFVDYLDQNALIILDEPVRLREYLEFAQKERAEEYTGLLQAGKVLMDPTGLFLEPSGLFSALECRQSLFFSILPRQWARPQNMVNFTAKPIYNFAGKFAALAEEIKALQAEGYGIAIMAGNQEHGDRIQSILRDLGVNAPALTGALEPSQVGILPLGLREGFQLPQVKLALICESEITRRPKKGKAGGQKIKGKLAPFVDLKQGDYVVHATHGIGVYVGMEKLDIGGVARDYFLIRYAGEDKLYVPFDQVNQIQKYLGGEGQTPKLFKLGGNDWIKVKNKVKAAVREMAEELLKLYAEREKAVGYSFSEDKIWQKEFEDRFPYEETPDQLQCINDVKADMVKPRPMDRLVCGDVGYGKTEVAIRAAFKAVMDGKQVAVLVPTTILAQQHFVTFSERFAGYPMTIEMLSRFRSPKEQKMVIEGLKSGSVDVVIGTHRLVSEDIKFKDLGLMIVDEEQRFGVSHKERLKQLKTNVDVLTLSATPIPRTLHMAMVNIRDMSVIETPPEDRYPVQTFVAEYSHELVREAIRREINRGGQVFYVHNRIQDLDKIMVDLGKLVPEARAIYAHGQMREDELEQVMLDFMERRYDLLVCTTIIESGLDLPNANTLIVSDADYMGLSQLYQLRGRVGRSNRKAFAYFLYRKDKMLSEIAEKRLSAIRDFTEFGSGFKIAMRDLELRGAGNLLGGEQHGHMAAVGFDMFCKLLEQAVKELKGEKSEEIIEPAIELNIDAYLSGEYIKDTSIKMDFYQRLMRTRSLATLEDITAELIDRFGDPPQPTTNLLGIVAIRIKAMQLGIAAVTQEQDSVRIKFGRDPKLSGEQLMQLAKNVGPMLSFASGEGLGIKLRLNPKFKKPLLKTVAGLLDEIISIADKPVALV